VDDGLWATMSEGFGINVATIRPSFQDFQLICDPDPPTLQTDGRTDGRHAIAVPRFALPVYRPGHRAVKK